MMRPARFTRTAEHAKDGAFKIGRPDLRAMMWREHRYQRLRKHRLRLIADARAEAQRWLVNRHLRQRFLAVTRVPF
jgi:hypothetical protein